MAPYEYDIIKPILESDHIEGYDDNIPLQLQTPTLKSYIDDLHQMQLKEKEEAEQIKKQESD